MEQYSEYLMWVKRKNNILVSHSSWEEEAFMEDARGPLGGFVWPPRSYSCSFCKREFRSAQALGGHMNVHRRERAKLKQSHQNPNHSRVSPLGQESRSNSDTKSCVCDEVLVLGGHDINGGDDVETNLYLGFGLDCAKTGYDEDEVVNFKRQKTAVMPLIMGAMEEVDLELRLAS